MKATLFSLFAAFLFVSTATAASTPGAIASAARALHYPHAGALKITCRGSSTFRCVAVYRHHRRRVFYAKWQGEGGWVCAGPKAATCKTLRHGFITAKNAAFYGGVANVAELAAKGYVQIHYAQADPQVGYGCSKAAAGWTFCYSLPTGTIGVTVTAKPVKGGWVTAVSVS